MNSFYINGYLWHVEIRDPYSPELIDRTGKQTLATTDPTTGTIYLSSILQGDLLRTVLLHELGHVVMISYNLLNDLHRMTYPRHWIEMEEWICNFMANYGSLIFQDAYSILNKGG